MYGAAEPAPVTICTVQSWLLQQHRHTRLHRPRWCRPTDDGAQALHTRRRVGMQTLSCVTRMDPPNPCVQEIGLGLFYSKYLLIVCLYIFLGVLNQYTTNSRDPTIPTIATNELGSHG
jgi:hypothetical protein